MLNVIAFVRREERRDALGAFLTLFALMAGHALLETARDALFLARLPASQLPWVYLAITVLALAATTGEHRTACPGTLRHRFALLLGGGAAVNLIFWAFLRDPSTWVYYALYIWGGVFVSLCVVLFWSLAGGLFTPTQARRIYGPIGAGSVIGAVVGAGIASLLTGFLGVSWLLPASAFFIALAAVVPLLLMSIPEGDAGDCDPLATHHTPQTLVARCGEARRAFQGNPYVQRLGLIVLISSVAVTIVDFLFKSTVAALVPPEELGATFARFYLVLNSLSLVAQLFLVTWFMRVAGVIRSLGFLPLLLMMGGIVQLVAGAGVLTALLLKGIDGGLRHSLHRTAIEILYLPLSSRVRAVAKPIVDVLGQRGGQALASLLILAALRFQVDSWLLGGTVILLTLLWMLASQRLEGPYLNLFRDTLEGAGLAEKFSLPSLDLSSLEKLMAALNSSDDRDVIAALDLLEEQGRGQLVPALILYHPSAPVVERALRLLVRTERDDYLMLAERLLNHPTAEVRTVAIRALTQRGLGEEALEAALNDVSPQVRAAAWVGLVAGGFLRGSDAERRRQELFDHNHVAVAEALARAIHAQPNLAFEDLLLQLARSEQANARSAVAEAMGAMPSPRFLGALTWMLADRQAHVCARRTLVSMGASAFDHLVSTLADPAMAPAVRRQLPRAIAHFDADAAARALEPYLVREKDGMVRFRVLRALDQLRSAHPEVRLDHEILSAARDAALTEAYRTLDWRLRLGAGSDEGPRGAGYELLEDLLLDRHNQAIDRLFRMLELLHPDEDFKRISRGLRSSRREVRSSCMELLDAALDSPVREATLALVDARPEAERLNAGRVYYPRSPGGHRQFLRGLLESESHAIRSFAAYYVREAGIQGLGPAPASPEPDAAGLPWLMPTLEHGGA